MAFENSFSDINEHRECVTQEFMYTFFPCWTWDALLRAFDCGPDQLAHDVRLNNFAAIAVQEKLCPKKASM